MKSVIQKAGIILPLLHGLGMSYKKDYSYPSYKKILSMIAERTGVLYCIRTLCYWMKEVEEEGLVKRTKRHHHDGTLGMVFSSTMYQITASGYVFLWTLGINILGDLKKCGSKMIGAFLKLMKGTKKFVRITVNGNSGRRPEKTGKLIHAG